jgi:hypothetical protein
MRQAMSNVTVDWPLTLDDFVNPPRGNADVFG